MGEKNSSLSTGASKETIIMLVGLQGSGKTTTCAKLALHIRKKGRTPLLVPMDLKRPGAITQLQVLAKQVNIPSYNTTEDNVAKVLDNALKFAESSGADTLILDTAGRLHIDQELMDELKLIMSKVSPSEVLLVTDAMTGQDATNSAKSFNDQIGLTGVILTKLDGDTRGGAALSIRQVTGKPIKFVGIGEQLDKFEEFTPDRIASRILGMGDIVSLVEKAQEVIDLEKAKELEKKLRKQEFTLNDLLEQLKQIKKMGSLKELIAMIPGLAGISDKVDENEIKKIEAILLSMTPDERNSPEIINGPRRSRIAKGSGTSVTQVNSLLSEYREMKKLMGKMGKFQKLFGKKGLPKLPF
jgi:signal recognition particle subunit SRP54